MHISNFTEKMQQIAPRELKMDYDNVGLLIGPEKQEIRRVLVALDCTSVTAKEAIEWGADLMLTHHPVFFRGTKRIAPDDPATAGAYMLIRHGIGLFAAHTNLDAAEDGVNYALAEALGVRNAVPMEPDGLGRIGTLAAPVSFGTFAKTVEEKLNTAVRISGEIDRIISRVAVIGGAAGEYAQAAHDAGADVFVTGECRHHEALYAREAGICLIDAGHYETEKTVLNRLIGRLHCDGDDVQYKVSEYEYGPLRRL